MAARIRAHDWGATPLGPVNGWPQSLRTSVDTILGIPDPAVIWWGPHHVQIYNDPFIPVARERHPRILGQPASVGWADVFEEVQDLLSAAMDGRAVELRDYVGVLDGPAGPEERVFDASWSPLRDEWGVVAGALQILIETTERRRASAALRESEERQAFLLQLSDKLRPLTEADEIQSTAVELVGRQLRASRTVYGVVSGSPGEERLRITGQYVTAGEPVPEFIDAHAFGTELVKAMVRGEWLGVADTATDPRIPDANREAHAAANIAAYGCVSLMKQGRAVAVLSVLSDVPRAWTASEQALLTDVADRTWDAVERARAEASLAQSELQYRSLFETMGQGYVKVELVRDPEGHAVDFTYLELNSAFERLFGIPAEQAKGRRGSEIFPGLESYWHDAYSRILRTSVPERLEFPVESLGTWYEAFAYPQAGDRLTVLYEDVTERKRREAVLRESEQRFRALATTGAFSIYRMSPDWRLMYQLDGGTLETTADPIEDWVGKYIPADDLPAVRDAIGNAIRTKSMFELEHRVRVADGGIGWVLSRAVPLLDDGGEVVEWFGAGSDVTERREAVEALRTSEARYQALFAASPVPFMVLAANPPDYTITAANDAYFAATLTTPETLIGRRLFDVFTDDPSRPGQLGSQALDISLARVLRTRRTDAMERVRYDIRTPDGGFEEHWWLAINAPLFDPEGNVTAIIHQVDRQTELHHAETAIRANVERQTFLLKLGDALRTAEGIEAVGGLAARMIADELGLDRVYFVTANSDNDEVLVTHEVRRADLPAMLGLYHSSDFPGAIKEFLERSITYADVRVDPRLTELDRQSFAGFGAVGFAAVPIRRGSGTLIWAIGAVSTKPRHWAAGDIVLLEEAAERTWAAIERARTDAALRASEQALAADLAGTSLLRDLAERLVTEEDLATIREEILSAAMTITRSDAGTIQIYEPETRSLFLLVTRGFGREMIDRFRRVDADSDTACGGALREGRRTFIDFDGNDTDEACRMHVEAGYRSAQATPLLSRAGAPLGMLNTHWRASGHRPSERELRFLDLLARQAADLIERAQAQQQLRESEERLREFGEASSDVLWIRDAETFQWTYLTPAFETIYGVDREAALSGDNMAGWTELIEPEDRGRAVESLRRVRMGERVSFEYRIRRPIDGAVRWLRNTDFPMRDPAGAVRWIGGIGRDITEEKKTADRMGVLVAELQHRTRNLMGVVRSTTENTLRSSESLDDFAPRFRDRIGALARVNGLLSRLNEHDRVTFDEVIGAEMEALGQNGGSGRVTLDGPQGVALRSSTVQTFALALHELATNAVKYGALGQPGGHLSVRWRLERPDGNGEPWLHVEWAETGVAMPPADAKPQGGGAGRTLIESALPYQLGARTSYVLAPDGVRCSISLPVSARTGGGNGDVREHSAH